MKNLKRKYNVYLLTLCLASLSAVTLRGQSTVKNVVDFGAKPDTNVMNTIAIQKTIDAIAATGGGTVIIPAGEFRTGNLEMKSGVNLHLEPGAVLAGSDKRKDYDTYEKASLIFAKGQKNISITGSGTIDGRGRQLMNDIFKRLQKGTLTDPAWRLTRPGEGTRTNLIYFEECENIVVKNATLKDASSWVTHYERCRYVIIDSIRLESVAYWNNDGIDIVDCRKMRITNSYIDAADDAICLKSARRGDFCDSIYIANCTLRSSANALKFGTGSIGGFKNVTVRNLTIFNTFRTAIALEAVDGGFLENVDIRDVVATNTGNALIIRLGHRNKDDVYSTVKNIYIANMKVTVPKGKPDAGYETEGPILMYPPGYTPTPGKIESISPWNYKERSPNVKVYEHNVFPSSVSGLPGHPVENVKLENIEVIYETVASKDVNYFPLDSFHIIVEAERDYPEFSMFGELPVWGFYARHVEGLTMKNVKMKMKGKDFRIPYLFNDVNNLLMNDVKAKGKYGKPKIFLNKVTMTKKD